MSETALVVYIYDSGCELKESCFKRGCPCKTPGSPLSISDTSDIRTHHFYASGTLKNSCYLTNSINDFLQIFMDWKYNVNTFSYIIKQNF